MVALITLAREQRSYLTYVVWIAYHVILSGFHSLDELAVHSVLFAVSTYILFRPEATKYFRGVKTEPESGTIE